VTAPVPSDTRALATRLLVIIPPAILLLVALATPTAALFPDQSDVDLYRSDAQQVGSGLVPYRDFALEYPPGALVPMVVPYVAGGGGDLGLDSYQVLFADWEACLLLVLALVLARVGPTIPGGGRAVLRLIPVTIGAALALTWRYDLFPAMLTAVALWAALERRPGPVGIAIGVGVLAKLYPVVLLPALAVPWLIPLDVRRLIRLAAAFVATVALGLLPFVALAGDDAFAFLNYQVGRGLQIESIGGSFVLLVGLLTGSGSALSYGFGAIQVEGDLARAWLALLPAVTVAAFGIVAVFGWRRLRRERGLSPVDVGPAAPGTPGSAGGGVRPETLVTLAFASLMLLLVTSKVYSIQYVVWIVPFVALQRGGRFWLGLAITALTMPIHPILYTDLVAQQALPILVLSLRNALVLVLTAWLLIDVARGGMARPARLELTTFRSAT
jgi:hypothetical protein